MLLADMGAEVIRVERAAAAARAGAGHAARRRHVARSAQPGHRPQAARRRRRAARPRRAGRRPDRGVPPGCDGAPRRRARRVPRPQPAARLRADDRAGARTVRGPTAAGHDINYISLAGALAHFRRAGQPPTPPLNLVGDYGGGAMFLAFGVVCALLEAQRSGQGQVVDAAMVDGARVLMTMFWTLREIGVFDENAPGHQPARHRRALLRRLRVRRRHVRLDRRARAAVLRRAAAAPRPRRRRGVRRPDGSRGVAASSSSGSPSCSSTKTRDEWCALLDATDVCFAPVLTMSEAAAHPHNVARSTFVEVDGSVQPAPAPRFSRTPAAIGIAPAHPGEHSREILADWGVDAERIEALDRVAGRSSTPEPERPPTSTSSAPTTSVASLARRRPAWTLHVIVVG